MSIAGLGSPAASPLHPSAERETAREQGSAADRRSRGRDQPRPDLDGGACGGATLRQLAWAHDWHIREETYAAALARLIDFHRALPLSRLWGTGTTSSSDGQYYQAGGRGEALGDVNARHGNEPGVAFYLPRLGRRSERSARLQPDAYLPKRDEDPCPCASLVALGVAHEAKGLDRIGWVI